MTEPAPSLTTEPAPHPCPSRAQYTITSPRTKFNDTTYLGVSGLIFTNASDSRLDGNYQSTRELMSRVIGKIAWSGRFGS